MRVGMWSLFSTYNSQILRKLYAKSMLNAGFRYELYLLYTPFCMILCIYWEEN